MPYCAPFHQPQRLPQQQQQEHALSASVRGYGVTWRRFAKWFLQQNQLCVDPFGVHACKVVTAEVVDHIVPRKRA